MSAQDTLWLKSSEGRVTGTKKAAGVIRVMLTHQHLGNIRAELFTQRFITYQMRIIIHK